MSKYPSYRDSQVSWIGEIPSHWTLGKLGTLLKPISIKNQPDLPLLSITRELGVIERNLDDDEGNHNFIPDDLSGYKVIHEGQFGMNKMKAWQGSYGISRLTGIVSPAYYVFDFTGEIDPRFFHLAIRSKNYVAFFGRASDGVRIGQWDLSKSRMKEIPFFIPPAKEQTAIANFLDDKTAKIDRAIAQKEQLIALLKERKQIIIQNAVTKGLDPNVKMKDSGVEWIGEIPEHWKVESLKNILVERNEKNDPIKSKERLSLSIDKGITLYAEKTTNLDRFKDDFSQYKLAHENDLVFNSMNMIVGAVGVSLFFGCVSPVYYTYYSRVQNKNITKFYEWFFKSRLVQSQLYSMGRGIMAIDRGEGKFNTVRLKVPRHELRSFNVPFPGESDLNEIVEFIDRENQTTSKAILLQQTQIEKLKEYKATLIDSAVTGKIKVS